MGPIVTAEVSEGLRDFPGDWRKAVLGQIYATFPHVGVLDERIISVRGRAQIPLVFPEGTDTSEAELQAERIAIALSEFIRLAKREAALRARDSALGAKTRQPASRRTPDHKLVELLHGYSRRQLLVGDFSGVRVPSGSDLHGALLRHVKLQQATFRRVGLIKADLRGADLRGANMTEANLSGSLLHEADLRHTVFRQANLAGAELHRVRANFSNAAYSNLRGADLRGADFRGACFLDADLDGADVEGMLIDAASFRVSGWTANQVMELRERGLQLTSLSEFPEGIRDAVLGKSGDALCMYFPGRLDLVSETVVKALILGLLGDRANDCESEYRRTESGGTLVRLSGTEESDMFAVADALGRYFANQDLDARIQGAVDRTVSAAVHGSIETAMETALPRALAPIAALQAQLGDRLSAEIGRVYDCVERTELQLAPELADAIGRIDSGVLEAQLQRSGWAFDAKAMKLVREGAWAIGTGAAGSALVELLKPLM